MTAYICMYVCGQVMWMSSGGTSSVVHTDSSDNIICVYRGQKYFVMVDPSLYADKVCTHSDLLSTFAPVPTYIHKCITHSKVKHGLNHR